MNDLVKGTLAGFIATAPMTVAMIAMHRLLPRRQQYRLPPRQVTMQVIGTPRVRSELGERGRTNATLVSHFAYGAAWGAAYGPIARQLRPPSATGGIAHGLATWTINYLGLLPALGILEPATRHPAQRNALMIAAHVVWGAAVGSLVERMLREDERAGNSQNARSGYASSPTPLRSPQPQIH